MLNGQRGKGERRFVKYSSVVVNTEYFQLYTADKTSPSVAQ